MCQWHLESAHFYRLGKIYEICYRCVYLFSTQRAKQMHRVKWAKRAPKINKMTIIDEKRVDEAKKKTSASLDCVMKMMVIARVAF